MFLERAVLMTSSVAEDMISSNPAYTMSNSLAPSSKALRLNRSSGNPVAF